MTVAAVGGSAAVVLTVAGVVALRRVWNDPSRRSLVVIGWLLLAVAGMGWLRLAAADKAVAYAMLAPSLVAFAVVAAGADFKRKAKHRPARDAAQSIELTAGRSNTWRGTARTALAGPVSALAAIAIGMLVATKAPFGDAARLIAAGLLAPAVWAGFMVWSLYDSRLDKVFAALVLIALTGGAGAYL